MSVVHDVFERCSAQVRACAPEVAGAIAGLLEEAECVSVVGWAEQHGRGLLPRRSLAVVVSDRRVLLLSAARGGPRVVMELRDPRWILSAERGNSGQHHIVSSSGVKLATEDPELLELLFNDVVSESRTPRDGRPTPSQPRVSSPADRGDDLRSANSALAGGHGVVPPRPLIPSAPQPEPAPARTPLVPKVVVIEATVLSVLDPVGYVLLDDGLAVPVVWEGPGCGPGRGERVALMPGSRGGPALVMVT